MRVLIAGMDGYLGWPLSMYLTSRGHEVAGLDRFLRRAWVAEMESDPSNLRMETLGWSHREDDRFHA